jgi:hypothetical protein
MTMSDNTNSQVQTNTALTMQRWGGLASFLLAIAFIVAPLIYLFGNLRDAFGALSYSVADTLYGPVWGASLITAVFALRERIGGLAQRRMSLALIAAVLAAGAMVLVACIRAANRHYHLIHPDLHLEENATVLIVWATIVAGVTAAGWHFLGWSLVLIGSAGWTSGLPRALCILYLAGGISSLFVYLFPQSEGTAAIFGAAWAVWQGILLWTIPKK